MEVSTLNKITSSFDTVFPRKALFAQYFDSHESYRTARSAKQLESLFKDLYVLFVFRHVRRRYFRKHMVKFMNFVFYFYKSFLRDNFVPSRLFTDFFTKTSLPKKYFLLLRSFFLFVSILRGLKIRKSFIRFFRRKRKIFVNLYKLVYLKGKNFFYLFYLLRRRSLPMLLPLEKLGLYFLLISYLHPSVTSLSMRKDLGGSGFGGDFLFSLSFYNSYLRSKKMQVTNFSFYSFIYSFFFFHGNIETFGKPLGKVGGVSADFFRFLLEKGVLGSSIIESLRNELKLPSTTANGLFIFNKLLFAPVHKSIFSFLLKQKQFTLLLYRYLLTCYQRLLAYLKRYFYKLRLRFFPKKKVLNSCRTGFSRQKIRDLIKQLQFYLFFAFFILYKGSVVVNFPMKTKFSPQVLNSYPLQKHKSLLFSGVSNDSSQGLIRSSFRGKRRDISSVSTNTRHTLSNHDSSFLHTSIETEVKLPYPIRMLLRKGTRSNVHIDTQKTGSRGVQGKD